MLDTILNQLAVADWADAGLAMHGLHIQPGNGAVRLSLLDRAAPFELGALFLDGPALRQVAGLLLAAADAIEAPERQVA